VNDESRSFIPGRNGGRLRNGGPNQGGPGRPKDAVRAACRLAFDKRLPRLQALADSDDAAVALKALDMLARYGGLNYTETETTGQSPVEAMLALARAQAAGLPAEE
jgi:hypothetical protein